MYRIIWYGQNQVIDILLWRKYIFDRRVPSFDGQGKNRISQRFLECLVRWRFLLNLLNVQLQITYCIYYMYPIVYYFEHYLPTVVRHWLFTLIQSYISVFSPLHMYQEVSFQVKNGFIPSRIRNFLRWNYRLIFHPLYLG